MAKVEPLTDRRRRRSYQADRYAWLYAMGCVARLLPDDVRAQLDAWQRDNVTGSGEVGTSDWPGWRDYLPPKPDPDDPQELSPVDKLVYLTLVDMTRPERA